eukprot:468373-Rhodomonas_salina.2
MRWNYSKRKRHTETVLLTLSVPPLSAPVRSQQISRLRVGALGFSVGWQRGQDSTVRYSRLSVLTRDAPAARRRESLARPGYYGYKRDYTCERTGTVPVPVPVTFNRAVEVGQGPKKLRRQSRGASSQVSCLSLTQAKTRTRSEEL